MITALLLAAGQSKRMGQPKMLLPWGNTTVFGQVIETIRRAGLDDILVVTGGAREQVEMIAARYGLRVTQNENFEGGEMLSSLQCGLRVLGGCAVNKSLSAEVALICLGDQPQVQEGSVRAVVRRFVETGSRLVVPSYQMRRGHPWLVARPLWEEVLDLRPPESPRDFLNRHASEIDYVDVDNPSILADLDTFEDYLKSRPYASGHE
jgi:molybdenum cofactor cytidylyltransferase